MTWRRMLAWSAVPVFLVATALSVMADASMGHLNVDGVVSVAEGDVSVAWDLERFVTTGGFFLFIVVGALILGRRPDNAVGWIMVAIGSIAGMGSSLETYAAWVMDRRGTPDPLALLGAWLTSWYWYPLLALCLVYLPLLFPDGRLLSSRWRIPAVTTAVGVAAISVIGALTETLAGQPPHVYSIPNPIGIAGLESVEELPVINVAGGLLIFGMVSGLVALVVRFRRGSDRERQQLKWFLLPIFVGVLTLAFESLPILSAFGFSVVLLGMPVAIGVAVLRYRLYDIDRIVSRTVSYAIVTAALASIYIGLVFALRQILPVEGPLAVAASTLAVAALFNPLRRWVQEAVDRRFNRSRYDAVRTIELFSRRLRDEVDLNDLRRELSVLTSSTMQPSHLSLWLREDARG